jgi:nucleotide-binding universal stress UspA family protein
MNAATKSAKSLQTIAPGPVWINNILFLTDFSPVSTAALRHALSAARRFEAKVYVTHVLEPPLVAPPSAAFYEAAREEAEKKFDALLNEGELNDVLHEIILSEGPPSRVVEEIVREKRIDLIVVGTHGRKGFRKMMLGSVAEEIYRKASCPVLTVGPENPANPESEMSPQRILLATDLLDRAHRACDYAIAMALRHASELILLHVIEDQQVSDFGRAEQQRLASLARMEGLIPAETPLASKPKLVVARGHAADEIPRTAREYKADLIVIGLHGGERMGAYLPGTVAYRVICQAPCPVLTIPAAIHAMSA